jgi:hypothetical protein
MISLQIQDTKFQADFGRIITKARNPEKVLLNSGRALGNALRRWFRQRDRANVNKLSDRRVHFWLQVAQSVNQPVMEGPTSVSITISDPRFAQKLFGGTITAKAAGALTIPVEEKAYGRTAATFERETGLKLILVKVGGTGSSGIENAVLAVADPNDPNHLTVEYLLTKSVTQSADTEALPPKSDLERAILARAQKVLDNEMQEGNAA